MEVRKLSDTEQLLASLYNHDGEDIQYCKQPQVTKGVFKISRNSTNTYSAKGEPLWLHLSLETSLEGVWCDKRTLFPTVDALVLWFWYINYRWLMTCHNPSSTRINPPTELSIWHEETNLVWHTAPQLRQQGWASPVCRENAGRPGDREGSSLLSGVRWYRTAKSAGNLWEEKMEGRHVESRHEKPSSSLKLEKDSFHSTLPHRCW